MKKIILSIATVLGVATLSSCGGLGTVGSLVSANSTSTAATTAATTASNASSILGNLISTFAGGVLTNQSSLVGTWTYTQPCVQFDLKSATL